MTGSLSQNSQFFGAFRKTGVHLIICIFTLCPLSCKHDDKKNPDPTSNSRSKIHCSKIEFVQAPAANLADSKSLRSVCTFPVTGSPTIIKFSATSPDIKNLTTLSKTSRPWALIGIRLRMADSTESRLFAIESREVDGVIEYESIYRQYTEPAKQKYQFSEEIRLEQDSCLTIEIDGKDFAFVHSCSRNDKLKRLIIHKGTLSSTTSEIDIVTSHNIATDISYTVNDFSVR